MQSFEINIPFSFQWKYIVCWFLVLMKTVIPTEVRTMTSADIIKSVWEGLDVMKWSNRVTCFNRYSKNHAMYISWLCNNPSLDLDLWLLRPCSWPRDWVYLRVNTFIQPCHKRYLSIHLLGELTMATRSVHQKTVAAQTGQIMGFQFKDKDCLSPWGTQHCLMKSSTNLWSLDFGWFTSYRIPWITNNRNLFGQRHLRCISIWIPA